MTGLPFGRGIKSIVYQWLNGHPCGGARGAPGHSFDPLATLIGRVPVADPMAGFWARVEAWLQALMKDRARLARYMALAWWLSTAFVVLGVVVIFAVKLGWWDP